MATKTDYLKQAAANLRRAAEAMRTDIGELQHRLTQTEQDVRRQVSELERAIRENNMWLGRSDASDGERAQRLRKNGQLDSTIVDRRHELASMRDQITQQINDAERTMQGLYHQASQLDNQSGGPGFLNI